MKASVHANGRSIHLESDEIVVHVRNKRIKEWLARTPESPRNTDPHVRVDLDEDGARINYINNAKMVSTHMLTWEDIIERILK